MLADGCYFYYYLTVRVVIGQRWESQGKCHCGRQEQRKQLFHCMILLCFVSFCPRSCPDHDLGVLFDDDIQRIVIPCLIYIIVSVWPSNIYSIMKFINKILYKPASKRIICIFLIARAFVYRVTSRISLRKQSSNLIVRSLVPHKTNHFMRGKGNELVSTSAGD